MNEFDVIIIGAGPGGYVSAIKAAQLGAKVAVIERGAIGGTCLNRGCIPTKALYYSAKALTNARRAKAFGVNVGEIKFDVARAMERKDEVVKKLVTGVAQLLKGNGVEVINGTGVVEGAGKARYDSNGKTEVIAAKKGIIIATGSEPLLIPAFNIDKKNVLTSTEALSLTRVPESMLIIGGGVMGCEFATIFSAFGSSVTIVELLPSILSTEDRQVSRVVAKRFKETGVNCLTEVMVEDVEPHEGKVKTTLKDGRQFITEKVLVTIGRSLNSAGLGLESVGVAIEKGRVAVNEKMETNVKGIYAIGDVAGKMLLAHVATAEGMVAASNALGKDARIDYSCVPAGIFTDPEIASVGLKEKDLEGKGMEANVGRFGYAASGKALGMDEPDGFVQIIADKGTDKILGCSIVGAHATDLIGEVAVVMKSGGKVSDIAETIHAHPTLPEIVMEASEDAHGTAIHKMGRKRA